MYIVTNICFYRDFNLEKFDISLNYKLIMT